MSIKQDEPIRVPVVEEQVRVDTRPVEIVRTRIAKTVRARDEIVDVPLLAQEVRVERVPLDPPRVVDAPPEVRHDGDTTIIPVLEERLVVEKRLVVREELRITRLEHEYRDPQRVSLRSEHVSVERSWPGGAEARHAQAQDSPAPSLAAKSQENVMDRMLVGVFDSKQQMEAACRDLRDRGIPNDRVRIHSGTAEQALGGTDFSQPEGDGRGTGFFDRLFGRVEDDGNRHARLYSEAVRRGGCVVVVDGIGDDRLDEVVQILERDGAYDIDERAARWRETGWKGDEDVAAGELAGMARRDTTAERTDVDVNRAADEAALSNDAGANRVRDEAGTKIPVVEEQLNVGKREVQRGGVRVFTHTTERPVEENVTLREERARVERRPVDRPATAAELGNAFEDKSVELRETAEEPVVEKTARVVEEVDVGKEVSSRTETVRDTVRRRDVEVEDLPASRVNQPANGDRAGRR